VKPRRQCKKCPWKKGVDPFDIPDGYDAAKHAALADTIADPESLSLGPIRMMTCHETVIGAELPCVGWLIHQLGPGNNIALRLRVATGQLDANVRTVGKQHETFADTLPKVKAPDSASSASRRSSQE
jgi:hypothetical protein